MSQNVCFYLGGIEVNYVRLDDILQYDPENNKWIYCGKTKEQREFHAMDVVPFSDIQNMCDM